MATIRFSATTTATPEQFTAAVTDFGPGRSELFGNTDDSQLVVHDSGPGWADVTEGKGPAWERLRYDWSDPSRIEMKTTDSNVWGGASGHSYTLTEHSDGATTIDVVIVREGKNLKGHLLATLFALGGKKVLRKAFDNTVRAIEARNIPSTTPISTTRTEV